MLYLRTSPRGVLWIGYRGRKANDHDSHCDYHCYCHCISYEDDDFKDHNIQDYEYQEHKLKNNN